MDSLGCSGLFLKVTQKIKVLSVNANSLSQGQELSDLTVASTGKLLGQDVSISADAVPYCQPFVVSITFMGKHLPCNYHNTTLLPSKRF